MKQEQGLNFMSNVPNPTNWMLMSQSKVLDSFHNLPGAFSDGIGQRRFVWIPGTRKDRVLLVAHADTVFGDSEIKLGFENDIFFSKNRATHYNKKSRRASYQAWGVGIGADDRAGCAIVWELQKLGHSILITSGEERGGIASHWIMETKYWRKKINLEHQFVVQFDRHGSKDLVFYDVGTNAFVNYVAKETKYTPAIGSFTDICILCKKICGVNISVGYYNEHTSEEKLVYSQWLNTLHIVYNWLSQPNLPKFELDQSDIYIPYRNYGNYDDIYRPTHTSQSYDTTHTANKIKSSKDVSSKISTEYKSSQEKLKCVDCGETYTAEEFHKNKFRCIMCHSYLIIG